MAQSHLCLVLGTLLENRLWEARNHHDQILPDLEVRHDHHPDLLLSSLVSSFALAQPREALLARCQTSHWALLFTFRFLPRKRLSFRTRA
jgi:hypothetical protein